MTGANGSPVPPRIAVYGATGFTGRKVARELIERGAHVVLAGRNGANLEAVASEAGGDAEIRVAALEDQDALRRAFGDVSAVVGCAGPFMLHGEPVARAAIAAGANYLDISGEQPYIARIFAELGPSAEEAGVALVPAVGMDSVPGDMLSALAAEGMGPLDRVTIVLHAVGNRVNSGSIVTLLDMWKRGDPLAFEGGKQVPDSRRQRSGQWELSDVGRVSLNPFPGAAEVILIPRHIETGAVEMFVTAGSLLPRRIPAAAGAPAFATARALARTPAYRVLRWALQKIPAPASDVPVQVECEVQGRAGRRRAWLRADGAYRLTAAAAAEAALRTARAEFDGVGPLSPAEAFDPGSFLDSLAEAGVQYEVQAAPTSRRLRSAGRSRESWSAVGP